MLAAAGRRPTRPVHLHFKVTVQFDLVLAREEEA